MFPNFNNLLFTVLTSASIRSYFESHYFSDFSDFSDDIREPKALPWPLVFMKVLIVVVSVCLRPRHMVLKMKACMIGWLGRGNDL